MDVQVLQYSIAFSEIKYPGIKYVRIYTREYFW